VNPSFYAKRLFSIAFQVRDVRVFTAQMSLPEHPIEFNFLDKIMGMCPSLRPPHPLEFTVDNPSWAQVTGREKYVTRNTSRRVGTALMRFQ
jgi:hypothetical protein